MLLRLFSYAFCLPYGPELLHWKLILVAGRSWKFVLGFVQLHYYAFRHKTTSDLRLSCSELLRLGIVWPWRKAHHILWFRSLRRRWVFLGRYVKGCGWILSWDIWRLEIDGWNRISVAYGIVLARDRSNVLVGSRINRRFARILRYSVAAVILIRNLELNLSWRTSKPRSCWLSVLPSVFKGHGRSWNLVLWVPFIVLAYSVVAGLSVAVWLSIFMTDLFMDPQSCEFLLFLASVAVVDCHMLTAFVYLVRWSLRALYFSESRYWLLLRRFILWNVVTFLCLW